VQSTRLDRRGRHHRGALGTPDSSLLRAPRPGLEGAVFRPPMAADLAADHARRRRRMGTRLCVVRPFDCPTARRRGTNCGLHDRGRTGSRQDGPPVATTLRLRLERASCRCVRFRAIRFVIIHAQRPTCRRLVSRAVRQPTCDPAPLDTHAPSDGARTLRRTIWHQHPTTHEMSRGEWPPLHVREWATHAAATRSSCSMATPRLPRRGQMSPDLAREYRVIAVDQRGYGLRPCR
jgi:hypothetical protein